MITPFRLRPPTQRHPGFPRARWVLLAALALPAVAQAQAPRGASPLQLRDVFAAVDSAGYAGLVARGGVHAAESDVTAALAGVLPSARVEAGTARTTDPIGVFGAKLRQRVVTAADFDPAVLNRPDALTVASAAVVVEQPIFVASAWMGRRAATLAARATRAAAQRTDENARLDASRGYYGAIVAAAGVRALDAAIAASSAHVRQASTLERNGVVTHSDVLLAEVRLSELQAQRATAQGQALMARLALAVQMGQPGDTSRALPGALPSTGDLISLITTGWTAEPTPRVSSRRDVEAARLGVEAARANVRRATAQWIPTVGAMARTDWVSSSQPFAGAPFWTVGVVVSLPVFSGGADVANRQRAVAELRVAGSRAAGAAAHAALEATQARIEREVAVQRLDLAERAFTQAREAVRLVQRRYDGGLAAITELLDAGAARTSAELATVSARHDVLVALAAERVALGLDLTPLLALDR